MQSIRPELHCQPNPQSCMPASGKFSLNALHGCPFTSGTTIERSFVERRDKTSEPFRFRFTRWVKSLVIFRGVLLIASAKAREFPPNCHDRLSPALRGMHEQCLPWKEASQSVGELVHRPAGLSCQTQRVATAPSPLRRIPPATLP